MNRDPLTATSVVAAFIAALAAWGAVSLVLWATQRWLP
jgi:hypothetical protein